MKNKRLIDNDEYIPQDPIEFLKCHQDKEGFKEVLYTFGEQEIFKDHGKFYLANTIYPNCNKEITREMATEIWQSCNMKGRNEISINFDLN